MLPAVTAEYWHKRQISPLVFLGQPSHWDTHCHVTYTRDTPSARKNSFGIPDPPARGNSNFLLDAPDISYFLPLITTCIPPRKKKCKFLLKIPPVFLL